MVKTTLRTIAWLAVILALLTALIGVTPTEAGEFVRTLWGYVVEFFSTVTGDNPPVPEVTTTPLLPDAAPER